MRRTLTAVVGAAALAAVTVTVAPANAQTIPDVPPLGFQIDPTEGAVGSTVNGQVNTADVAANCITDPVEFVSQFVNPDNPFDETVPYIGGWAQLVTNEFPDGLNDPENDARQFALAVAVFFPIGLALDLPQNDGTGELVDGALNQTFIMSFADAATASPIGDRGNFDPTTGAGSVTVPDVAPGVHPVISTCVAIGSDLSQEKLTATLDTAQAFVEANFTAPYPLDLFGEPPTQFAQAAARIAPVILESLVEPQALGIQLFCVTDASGVCPSAAPTAPPTAPPAAPPAAPVTARPNFAG